MRNVKLLCAYLLPSLRYERKTKAMTGGLEL
jgi:hypothetical protein